jgi:SAM-dependent methyltransferase
LGVGISALLSGSQEYFAFDVVKYSDKSRNLRILDELIELFRKREPIPDESEWPLLKPHLNTYEFPRHIFTDEQLDRSLKPDRIKAIRRALLDSNDNLHSPVRITYVAPWYGPELVRESTIDLIISQAVMEHVVDLENTYKTIYRWLKPGGFTSHQIDYKSHEISRQWNGHWEYPDLLWRLAAGKRTYWINRQPHSSHIALIKASRFRIVHEIKAQDLTGMPRSRLSLRFRNLSEDDFKTNSGYILAQKPISK